MTALRATIDHLRLCQQARTARYGVSLTTDPAWLVDMAINRRAGWKDDPGFVRGSCHPLPDGRYPPKASDNDWQHLCQLAHRINTPRLIVRPAELGVWRRLLLARIPDRFTYDDHPGYYANGDSK